jgi:hypothetical protein
VVKEKTGSFNGGLYFLAVSMVVSATIVYFLGVGGKERAQPAANAGESASPTGTPIAPAKA